MLAATKNEKQQPTFYNQLSSTSLLEVGDASDAGEVNELDVGEGDLWGEGDNPADSIAAKGLEGDDDRGTLDVGGCSYRWTFETPKR
jgi:hypothetical protein